MTINYHDHTTAVHGGISPEPQTGAIMTPIFQTSTYVQKQPGVHQGFDYSRADNPTRQTLETSLACLEKAKYALSFSSGLAAEQAIVHQLAPGSTVLVCDDVYGGTGRLFRQLYAKYNINFQFIDMTDDKQLGAAFREKIDLVWVETPTNPTLKIIDIAELAKRAKSSGQQATLVVDNTFSSPVFQKPLQLGADLVIHSTTKYMGGHSDLIGGAIMTSNQSWYDQLKFTQFAAGAVPSPFECFLLLRSIKTLAIRMHQHQKNADLIAKFLVSHPKVEKVIYPGLTSHPQHEIAKRQMNGYSGMISFIWQGSYESVVKLTTSLKLFALAESLGGVESLINHPEKMTHASVPEPSRRKLGITSNLLRLSVGIEQAEDLIADLEQAMAES